MNNHDHAAQIVQDSFRGLWENSVKEFPDFPLGAGMWSNLESYTLRDSILALILNAYSHRDREYHDVTHLAMGILEFRGLGKTWIPAAGISRRPKTLFLWSWFFHDFICVPGAESNEELSAACAYGILTNLGINKSFAEIVSKIILATKTHDVPEDIGNNKEVLFVLRHLLDTDMSPFGDLPEKFDYQGAQLQREAISAGLELDVIRVKRKVFFETLLKKLDSGTFFQLPEFKHLEPRVRSNLLSVLEPKK